MNLQNYPVFWKDVRILRVHLMGALVMQGILAALPFLLNLLQEDLFPSSAQDYVFPKIQIAITALIALAAAAQWYAEERVGRNELFLKRLAASKQRVWTEKLAAGVAVILAAILIQCVWIVIANQTGAGYWPDTSWPAIVKYLTLPTFFAYLVGLPLSLVMRRGFEVILCGMGIVFGAVILWSLADQNQSRVIVSLLAINGVLALAIAHGFMPKQRSFFDLFRISKITVLLKKEAAERRIVTNIAVALIVLWLARLLFGFEVGFQSQKRIVTSIGDVMWESWAVAGLWTAAFLCAAALGVTCYSENERSMTRCMLFHHPASRHYVFAAKVGYGLFWLLLLAVTYCSIEFLHGERIRWPWFFNEGLRERLFSADLLVAHFILIFACGVMLSRMASSAWFGLLAGLGFALFIYISIVILIYFEILPRSVYLNAWDKNNIKILDMNLRIGNVYLFSNALWYAAIGCIFAAWSVVTDRTFEAGGGWAKALYIGRLTALIVLWSPILALTGWRDLFYLLTHWD